MTQTVSSASAIGWWPPARSMIDNRRKPRPSVPSNRYPSSSGPRCVIVRVIASMSSRSTGAPLPKLYWPQIPHMGLRVHVALDQEAEGSEQLGFGPTLHGDVVPAGEKLA